MKVLVLSVFLLAASFAFAEQGIIQTVTGKVETKAANADWINAAAGQVIDNATIISTGFKGTAEVKLGNSILTVGPLTRLTLQEISEEQGGNETVTLNLQTGRVRADVKPPSGGKTDFTVRSPTATASVRGTTFEFDGIGLTVGQGLVNLSGTDGTAVNVSAGHSVATNPATGRTPSVAETVTVAMQPAAPVGVENTQTAPPVAVQPNTSIDVTVDWGN
jgi:hypothetical protein